MGSKGMLVAREPDFMIHGVLKYELFGQELWLTTTTVSMTIITLIILALAGSQMEQAAKEMGVPCAREFFADRAYAPDGNLAPRSQPGAVIHDTQVALDRVVRMIKEGKVQATNGEDIPVQCDSICVHGDNESAIAFVTAIRSRLAEEGITCQSFGSFVR